MELSYSFHLGNDKNKSIKARQQARNTLSGTTTKSNNAIQNVRQLGKVNHHNLRKYDNNQELIKTIKGSNDITKDVKELYLKLFDKSRIEYNNKQVRDDRKIDNYFNKISDDDKHDLACEIVIELGDMNYWDDKTMEYKYEMVKVFESQIKDLKEIVPDFYIANATIHFDESSPHIHIVGVPVKEDCKTGLSRQVGKTSIFTKESLVVIQDKMRERCIEEFNKVYGLDTKLKEKQKGKNRDITPYERLKFNEKTKELKQEISDLKDEVFILEESKQDINNQISKLNKDKQGITDEIKEKKKINNRILLKPKNRVWDENKKLQDQNSYLKDLNYQYKQQYESLKEKNDYLLSHIKKSMNKMPQFIKDIVNHIFEGSMDVQMFKRYHEPKKEVVKKPKIFRERILPNLFDISKEELKALRHINQENEEAAEEFYTMNNSSKEKDNGMSL